MNKINIIVDKVAKSYNGIDYVFRDISFSIQNGDVFGVLGPNGSGKSTLLKMLAKILVPTQGKVSILLNDTEIRFEELRKIQSYVSPYLVLFEEFKPLEHIEIYSKILEKTFNKHKALELIEFFGLSNSLEKHVKEFSSGMKQRMKFILAFLFEPSILLLDEPFTNLDEHGIIRVVDYLNNLAKQGIIVVIATNDKREAELCKNSIWLGKSPSNEPNLNPSI